jgi:hypothetical protein
MRETLQEIVARSAPPHWVREIYTKVQHCYAEAHLTLANCSGLDDAQRGILLPHFRRGLVETTLHRWSVECGMRATVESTKTDSHKFTLIRFGKIGITISKTNTSSAMPESCWFRKQHSRVNDMLMQQALFPVPTSSELDEELIYAIITHGPESRGIQLGFVALGFPNGEMSDWAEPPVSILDIQERQATLFQKPEVDLQEALQEERRTPKVKRDVLKNDNEDVG